MSTLAKQAQATMQALDVILGAVRNPKAQVLGAFLMGAELGLRYPTTAAKLVHHLTPGDAAAPRSSATRIAEVDGPV